jgi:hypothetical protein
MCIYLLVQFPLPKGPADDPELDMSRWFQNILGVLMPEIKYAAEGQGPAYGKQNINIIYRKKFI